MKIIVNAIPLLGANTGIARYIRCLYSEIEKLYGGACDIHYFNGVQAAPDMPSGPENLKSWSGLTDLFWKLPPSLALCVRLLLQYKRQRAFNKISSDYDVYHEAGFFPFTTPEHVKTVFTIHDMSIFRYPEHHPQERVLFMKKYLQARASLSDAFLTVSDFSKKEIVHFLDIPPDMITPALLSHSPELFHPDVAGDARERLDRAGVPGRYFLFVGSGDPRKNVRVIPRGIESSGLDIPLVNAGWGGWEATTGSAIMNLGYVSDEFLALLYQGALALIYPSIYEGFGLPVLEAMACGCPVVTTRMASLPEVAGDAALYMDDPHDPEELGRILVDLVQNPEERDALASKSLGNAARFSWAKTARTTMDVFEKVLEKGSRP